MCRVLLLHLCDRGQGHIKVRSFQSIFVWSITSHSLKITGCNLVYIRRMTRLCVANYSRTCVVKVTWRSNVRPEHNFSLIEDATWWMYVECKGRVSIFRSLSLFSIVGLTNMCLSWAVRLIQWVSGLLYVEPYTVKAPPEILLTCCTTHRGKHRSCHVSGRLWSTSKLKRKTIHVLVQCN